MRVCVFHYAALGKNAGDQKKDKSTGREKMNVNDRLFVFHGAYTMPGGWEWALHPPPFGKPRGCTNYLPKKRIPWLAAKSINQPLTLSGYSVQEQKSAQQKKQALQKPFVFFRFCVRPSITHEHEHFVFHQAKKERNFLWPRDGGYRQMDGSVTVSCCRSAVGNHLSRLRPLLHRSMVSSEEADLLKNSCFRSLKNFSFQ